MPQKNCRTPFVNQPSSARDWFGVALGKFRSGKSEDVADTCEQALKLYPADPNLLSLAARAYITMGMIDHARDRARAASILASPKSVIFGFPSVVSRMFDGLMSRWITWLR